MAIETLKSSCSHYDGRRLWLGKAALRSRLVDVRGWRGGRRFRDSILLEQVESVARSSSKSGGNLVFAMKDGSERSLRVSAPGIWRMQIDYRLRRISGLSATDPQDVPTVSAIKLDPSLPTADEVEHTLPIEEGTAPEESGHGSELAAWPRFEAEDATIEIVAAADPEPEYLTESVLVSEPGNFVPTELETDLVADREIEEREEVALVDALSFEIEAEEREEDHGAAEAAVAGSGIDVGAAEAEAERPVPEAHTLSVPPPEDLHEIGDDVVFDLAMDATTHEDVVIRWLSPMEQEAEAEPKPRLGIASGPFELRRLYEAPRKPEEEPESSAVDAPVSQNVQAAPDQAPLPGLSIEPVTQRERRPRRSMADLRPMSLAEFIRQSEPRWTRLAEID